MQFRFKFDIYVTHSNKWSEVWEDHIRLERSVVIGLRFQSLGWNRFCFSDLFEIGEVLSFWSNCYFPCFLGDFQLEAMFSTLLQKLMLFVEWLRIRPESITQHIYKRSNWCLTVINKSRVTSHFSFSYYRTKLVKNPCYFELVPICLLEILCNISFNLLY